MTPATLRAALSGNFDNMIAASTPGGIERQEKGGQIEQSMKDTLPIDGTEGDSRSKWEALGFSFGEKTDKLFVMVKFPEGWKKKLTDHSMYTDIVDEKGVKRGTIFYKAAFYDLRAFCYLEKAKE